MSTTFYLKVNHVRVKSQGVPPGLANARPPGGAKLAKAPPPGLTRLANAPRLPGWAGHRWN